MGGGLFAIHRCVPDRRGDLPDKHAGILALDLVSLEHVCERGIGFGVPGEQDEPRRGLIQSVMEPDVVIVGLQEFIKPGGTRTRILAGQSKRLVDDQDVGIFMDHTPSRGAHPPPTARTISTEEPAVRMTPA
jgi:hypothetical protein